MKYIKKYEAAEHSFINWCVRFDIKKIEKQLKNKKIKPNDRLKKINGFVFGMMNKETTTLNTISNMCNVDKAKWTLLMIAAYAGSARIIEILMEHADKSLLEETDQGLTALMLAAINGKMDATIKLIELGADVFYKKNGEDFYDMATRNIKEEILDVVGNKENIKKFVDIKKYNL